MDIFVKNKTSKRNSGPFTYNNNIIERCQPPHCNKLLTIYDAVNLRSWLIMDRYCIGTLRVPI